MAEPLVSCAWLQDHWLDTRDTNIVLLDGTFHLPMWKRDADAEYREKHIEGAVRFDFRKIRDTNHSIPLMLPTAEIFEEKVRELGISNDTHVVIYDNNANFGLFSVGRCWWMFKVFGHDNVSILDGGLPKWISEERPTVSGYQQAVVAGTFKANYHPHMVRNMREMEENYETKKEKIIDGRPKGRYDGTAPEPNPSLHSGHILGSTSLPFMTLLDPHTKTMKDKKGIREVFEKASADPSQPCVVMCGGAVTAPLVAFTAFLLGHEMPVYDGSWTEWVQKAPDHTKHLGVKGQDLQK